MPLVHQVLKAQLAGRRQGTAKTKMKSEVRGGGKKPFRKREPVTLVKVRPVLRFSQVVVRTSVRSHAPTSRRLQRK